MYNVCLSIDAKEELLSYKSKDILQINERINNLVNGLWKGGTRVKKLHAVNKKRCIYEARVDKARRMLFSIQHSSELGSPTIYVYSLAVEHDKVIRTARTLLGDNYSLELYKTEEYSRKKVILDDLIKDEEKNYPDQEFIYNFINDYKFYELSEDDWLRFMMQKEYSEEDFIDFKLRLTSEQKELVNHPLPMLIAGTAGSGKTTVLIYKLLANPTLPKLYITHSENLCREAETLFIKLIKGLDEEEEYIKNTEFTTFENMLYNSIGLKVHNLMSKERFINEYVKFARGNDLNKRFPPLMVWEEIRGVWKTKSDFSKMTLQEYVNLKEETAPNFVANRKEAYRIYQWYENLLNSSYIDDELDLIAKFIKSKEKLQKDYSMVVCDEVQDLTKLHILLLFKLADYNPNKLLIAGDDHQIINHSGFKWEEVKRCFYEELNKAKPELYTLNKNFRCLGNIANLANMINKLQEEFTEEKYKTKGLNSLQLGEPPTVIYGQSDDEIKLRLCDLGPTQAILVKTIEELESLKEYFKSISKKAPLIFTIEQAKGLEFDLIVLWKLVNDKFYSNETWNKIYRRKNQPLNNVLKKFVKYEASLLYVAITRAMKDCIIFEGNGDIEFWNMPGIKKHIKFTDSIWNTALKHKAIFSDEDWIKQGKKLLDKNLYNQALECFSRVVGKKHSCELQTLKSQCYALIEINNGNLDKAGDIYLNIGMISEAEKCYDNGEEYQKAMKLFEFRTYGNKDYEKFKLYSIKYHDKIENWNASAIYCKQNKLYLDSAIRFERCFKFKEAAIIYEVYLNNLHKAYEMYQLAGDLKGLKRCLNKLSQ